MARYQVVNPFPGVATGDILQLDETKRTFAMKGLVLDHSLFVLVSALIAPAIAQGYIVELPETLDDLGVDAGVVPRKKKNKKVAAPQKEIAHGNEESIGAQEQVQPQAPSVTPKTNSDGTIDFTARR